MEELKIPIKNLRKEIDENYKRKTKLDKILDYLIDVYKDDSDILPIKVKIGIDIENIVESNTVLNDKLKKLTSVCVHDWADDGHDSHYDYEKCVICGESRKI